MFRRFLMVVFVCSLFTAASIAQEGPKSALSINFGATFTQNNGEQPSGNAVYTLSYDHQFTSHSGIVLNYSNLQDQKFASPKGGVESNVNEATMGYVGRMFSKGKLSPFVVVGGGALIFSPRNNFYLASGGFPSTQTRAAFLYGAGADYNVCKNFGVRLQYRGLAYAGPSFHTADLTNGVTAHTAQTTLGFVFRF